MTRTLLIKNSQEEDRDLNFSSSALGLNLKKMAKMAAKRPQGKF